MIKDDKQVLHVFEITDKWIEKYFIEKFDGYTCNANVKGYNPAIKVSDKKEDKNILFNPKTIVIGEHIIQNASFGIIKSYSNNFEMEIELAKSELIRYIEQDPWFYDSKIKEPISKIPNRKLNGNIEEKIGEVIVPQSENSLIKRDFYEHFQYVGKLEYELTSGLNKGFLKKVLEQRAVMNSNK